MFLKRIRLENLLSFQNAELIFEPLTVLIGPNGSGKSNLLDVIGLLQALPDSFSRAVLAGGGGPQWMNKAADVSDASIAAELFSEDQGLRYLLRFEGSHSTPIVLKEQLSDTASVPHVYFERAMKSVLFDSGNGSGTRKGDASPSESFFSQFRAPGDPTPISSVGRQLASIQIYRDLSTSQSSDVRRGAPTSGPKRPLEPTGSNLALSINEFDFLGLLPELNRLLKDLDPGFESVKVRLEASTAQIYLQESGLSERIPALRMSDGTLRFLQLAVILLDPQPGSIVCIDEPETGLHPDSLRVLAKMLREACAHTQVIVTTHSSTLVDQFADEPESIVVVEREPRSGSSFKRLNRRDLEKWMDDYTLGDLWQRGFLGGNQY